MNENTGNKPHQGAKEAVSHSPLTPLTPEQKCNAIDYMDALQNTVGYAEVASASLRNMRKELRHMIVEINGCLKFFEDSVTKSCHKPLSTTDAVVTKWLAELRGRASGALSVLTAGLVEQEQEERDV